MGRLVAREMSELSRVWSVEAKKSKSMFPVAGIVPRFWMVRAMLSSLDLLAVLGTGLNLPVRSAIGGARARSLAEAATLLVSSLSATALAESTDGEEKIVSFGG